MAPLSPAAASDQLLRAPCSRCGTFVPRADCLYSDDGEVMCLQCREHLDEGVRARRAVRLLRGEGYAAGFMGLIGLPAAVFFPLGAFFMSGPAVAASLRVLLVLTKSAAPRSALGWHFGPVVVSAVLGLGLGAVGLVMMGFHFYALMS